MFHFPGCPPLILFGSDKGDGGSPPPGFPIRKSMDQCLLSAPHGFSQIAASFFGSWCQGILPVLLFAGSLKLRLSSIRPAASLLSSALCQWQCLVEHFYVSIATAKVSKLLLLLSLLFPLCSFQGALRFDPHGGLKWTRTTDLTLIRRVL